MKTPLILTTLAAALLCSCSSSSPGGIAGDFHPMPMPTPPEGFPYPGSESPGRFIPGPAIGHEGIRDALRPGSGPGGSRYTGPTRIVGTPDSLRTALRPTPLPRPIDPRPDWSLGRPSF